MNFTIIIFYILLIVPSFVILFLTLPFFFGAPFEPSRKKAVERMINLSNVKEGDKVADLGSGDGRIVIEFAKKGAEAHGYEINPILVFIARRKILNEGLKDRAFIHLQSFWNINLSDFNIIYAFQFRHVMPPLEKKILNEMQKGSKIVSNTWKFPNLKIKKKIEDIYLYTI